MGVTIYGIKNCDTMKKARAWLDKRHIAYVFHDYKTSGIDPQSLKRWMKTVGWETLLNQAGTTFRMTVADMQRLIRELGYEPRQRDNWYRLLN